VTISEQYRALNKDLHLQGSYGRKGDKWVDRVTDLVARFQPETILDYGCGQGALGRALNIPIAEYDPAIEGKDSQPAPADLVVCTDVLEHIEPDYLDTVLDDLKRVSKVCLFAVISTRPAKKFLADGRNAHLIVEPWTFWNEKLSERFIVDSHVHHGKEVEVILLPLT
jgi:2-polyprenyl-3-methyl-5-hydroxy-6-metoxy-1,4-benzoquinol methylase